MAEGGIATPEISQKSETTDAAKKFLRKNKEPDLLDVTNLILKDHNRLNFRAIRERLLGKHPKSKGK